LYEHIFGQIRVCKIGYVRGATLFKQPGTKKRPTKRALDAGDSAAIPSVFLRFIIFPIGRLRAVRPSASNANR